MIVNPDLNKAEEHKEDPKPEKPEHGGNLQDLQRGQVNWRIVTGLSPTPSSSGTLPQEYIGKLSLIFFVEKWGKKVAYIPVTRHILTVKNIDGKGFYTRK